MLNLKKEIGIFFPKEKIVSIRPSLIGYHTFTISPSPNLMDHHLHIIFYCSLLNITLSLHGESHFSLSHFFHLQQCHHIICRLTKRIRISPLKIDWKRREGSRGDQRCGAHITIATALARCGEWAGDRLTSPTRWRALTSAIGACKTM